MTLPSISIIIPHYDIPDLLMRCLESIPVSEDIQVVVVDDYSRDADSYLQRYPQLSRPYLEFVRTTRNGGAGYARNVGMEHARGEWLLFADADVFFADGMYDMIKKHADTDADLVFFRKKGVYSDDISRKSNQDAYLDEIMDTFLLTGDEWPIRTHYSVPWGKMIRRDLIIRNNIRFDEVKYANDCFFSVCAGYYAKKIELADDVLYCKTLRPGSLVSDFCKKPDELRIRSEVAFRVDEFLLKHDFCRNRFLPWYLIEMLKVDRPLFKFYFNNKLDSIYPSRFAAIKDICKGHPFFKQAGVVLYSLLVWERRPSVS